MARKVKTQLVENDLQDEELVNPELEAEEELETEEEIEEAADSNPTAGLEGNSKTNLLSVAMKKLSSMPQSDLIDFFNKSIAQIGHEADNVPDVAAKNQASIAMHSVKESIAEDLQTVFGDDAQLSEDFKTKMTTIFESAVSARMTLVEAQLEEAYEQALEEELSTITESLLEKLDDYLQYVCEEWLAANEVAVQSTIRSEVTEEFIEGLKGLFAESYIDVPEERLDVLEALAERVDSLEAQLNEALTENMKLSEAAKEMEKEQVIDSVAEGLSVLESEKFRTLVESVDFDENYEQKLLTIKEHHFNKAKTKPADTRILTEEITHDPNELEAPRAVAPEMKSYVAALHRTIKRV